MDSQSLQGASRTSGGILRGRAIGNVFNQADASDIHGGLYPVKGSVHVYKGCVDPTQNKPNMVVKADVTPNLVDVVKKMARSYSPVREHHLYVWEEGNWCVKGSYQTVMEEVSEEVNWDLDGGKPILSIAIVSTKQFYHHSKLIVVGAYT